MGPRAGLDRCGISRAPPGLDPWTVQPVEIRYTERISPARKNIQQDNFEIYVKETGWDMAWVFKDVAVNMVVRDWWEVPG